MFTKNQFLKVLILFCLVFSILSSSLVFAEEQPDTKHITIYGEEYIVEINDENLDETQIQEALEKGSQKLTRAVYHNCYPTGPYLPLKTGAWNTVYDSNGKVLYKFRYIYCQHSTSCSATQIEYKY